MFSTTAYSAILSMPNADGSWYNLMITAPLLSSWSLVTQAFAAQGLGETHRRQLVALGILLALLEGVVEICCRETLCSLPDVETRHADRRGHSAHSRRQALAHEINAYLSIVSTSCWLWTLSDWWVDSGLWQNCSAPPFLKSLRTVRFSYVMFYWRTPVHILILVTRS